MTVRKLLSKKNMIKYFDDAPFINEISELTNEKKNRAIKLGFNYLNLVRKGEESEVQIAKPYGKGKNYFSSKEEFLNIHNLSNNKTNVVIMGNVWPDYPNGYSNGLFTDYVDWYLHTLSSIKLIDNCNWILKSHSR